MLTSSQLPSSSFTLSMSHSNLLICVDVLPSPSKCTAKTYVKESLNHLTTNSVLEITINLSLTPISVHLQPYFFSQFFCQNHHHGPEMSFLQLILSLTKRWSSLHQLQSCLFNIKSTLYTQNHQCIINASSMPVINSNNIRHTRICKKSEKILKFEGEWRTLYLCPWQIDYYHTYSSDEEYRYSDREILVRDCLAHQPLVHYGCHVLSLQYLTYHRMS